MFRLTQLRVACMSQKPGKQKKNRHKRNRAAHKRFSVSRSSDSHFTGLKAARRQFPKMSKRRKQERKTDYAFVWRGALYAVHKCIQKKTQKYEIKARNETTAHNTQYWQLKICFRIKRNEKKNSRGARKLCFGFVLCKREGNGHLVMLLQ